MTPQVVAVLGILATASTLSDNPAVNMRRVSEAVRGYEQVPVFEALLDGGSLTLGEEATASFALRNVGGARIEACLGTAHGYHFWGTQWLKGNVTFSDHPACMKPFDLSPGQILRWTGTVRVLDVGLGAAKYWAYQEIVYPKDCDRSGCYGTFLNSEWVEVDIECPVDP